MNQMKTMKIETHKLNTVLDHIRPIIGRKATIPALSCVRLSCAGGFLKIEATDLDQQQSESIECDGKLEPCCVNFNSLAMALAGESTELQYKPGHIIVKSSIGMTDLETLGGDEFPPEMKCGSMKKYGVNCDDIATTIKQVVWAASDEVARYQLQSFHITGTAKMLTVESTNGRNLAVVNRPAISAEFEMLVSDSFSPMLCAALCRPGSVLSIGENHVRVDYEGGAYAAKQVDAKYPNTANLIGEKTDVLGEAPTAALQEIFTKLRFYMEPQKTIAAQCEFSKSGIDILMPGRNCLLEFHVPGKFKEYQCRLIVDSFLNCVKNCPGETVKILRGTELRKIVLESGGVSIHSMEAKEGGPQPESEKK